MSDPVTRTFASAEVSDLGWRYLLGTLTTSIAAGSLAQAADVVTRSIAVCGPDADEHLYADVRAECAIITLQTLAAGGVTVHDIELAKLISAEVGAGSTVGPRTIQRLELAIDAMDIAAVRRFWRAIMGYADDSDAISDPYQQGLAIWFQQMDQPRPQRNRIHVDISVPHDEARRRIDAAIAAGGVLLSDANAPAFWVLADPEGNEACVTTWQGRD